MPSSGRWRGGTEPGTYEETIFSKWITILFSTITAVFFFLWSYDIFVGWNWDDPIPSWFWLGMFLLFFGLTVLFFRLTININSEGLTVGYGFLKKSIPWEKVEDCHIDETSSLRYGGWGIRITRVRGKWRMAYKVVGRPRVVVSLNQGWIRELVFSTKDPEEAMEAIETHLKK